MQAILNTCRDFFMKKIATTASEFCKWVQVEIGVCMHLQKYQVKPHSSLWLSDALATAIAQRNNSCLQQKNKSSYVKSQVKLRW